MGVPRNATLAETIYRDIEKNEYLNRLYADLLYNYSLRLFSLPLEEKEIDIPSALRFAYSSGETGFRPAFSMTSFTA